MKIRLSIYASLHLDPRDKKKFFCRWRALFVWKYVFALPVFYDRLMEHVEWFKLGMLNDNFIDMILNLLNEMLGKCFTLVFFLIVLRTSRCNWIQLDILTFAGPPQSWPLFKWLSPPKLNTIICPFCENFYWIYHK